MGALEEISEKLDSTESKKNVLRKSISSLVTNWQAVEKDLELTQKSFQHYLSEHRNGDVSLPDETYLVMKEKELKEREVLLNGLSQKLESDREELALVEKMVLGRLREVGLTEERLELREKSIEERENVAGSSKLWVPLMEDREKALEMKEKEVALIREDLELKEKEIGMLLNLSEKREKELDKREMQLEVKRKFVEELQSSVKSLEEELRAKRKYSVELESSVKSLEENLGAKRKYYVELESSVKSLEENLGAKRKYYVELESSVKSLEKELEAKRKHFAKLESSVKSLDKKLEAKGKDFLVAEQRLIECRSNRELLEAEIMELRRKNVEELKAREKQWELKEKQCRSEKELLEIGKKELEQKMKEFEAREKASEITKDIERRRDLEHRNCAMKEIEVREKKLKAKEKQLEEVTQERLMDWQLKQKQCQSDNKALDLRMKEFEDRIKAFEIRETEFASKGKKVNDGISLEVAVELDGLDVHILLNGHKIDLSSPNEVSKVLRESGAPAFLVLSAMKVLYPPYLMTVDMLFEGSVGRSCILLLEQLIQISPTIESQHRKDALELATEWKNKISSGNTLEVLAFLYFLASFDLASSFDTEEVMKLFETVPVGEHAQIPDLCHRLCLKGRMSVSKSCIDQDQKEDRGEENPNCLGSDLTVEPQGQVEVSQIENPSTNLPKCLKGCKIDPELSNTDLGTLEPMAIIIANMDANSLFSFLNSHFHDHPFLQNEVLAALEISCNSAQLVLDVVECFAKSYPQNHGSRSCILLLHQLMRISPLNHKDVQETAKRIALDWKVKIVAESENSLANLVFLVFLSAFRLVSAFDSNELLQLYKIVWKQKSYSISEVIYDVVYSQLESTQNKTEAMQLEIKSPTHDIAPIIGVELFDSNVNMESNECRIPMFLKHSSNGAELVLDALDFTNFSDSKEKNISVVKSVYYLLKQLASVSPKIELCARKRASKFALHWQSTVKDSNSWEVFAFLLFVSVYGLFSSFGAKYVMGLLEVHSQLVKETSGIIRIFKLEHKVPGLVMNLIQNKQRLIAFDYVYEFNLVDKIPPVALLKKHVLDSKLAAKKCKKGPTETEALDDAISDEISSLKDVIKCILDHSLESKYSPDTLRERITCLEVERENLKKRMPADITNSSTELNLVEKEQLGQEHTRKRQAPDSAFVKDVQPPPSKKKRHRNKKFHDDQSSLNVLPVLGDDHPFAHQQAGQQFVTEDGRGNHWPYYDNLVPIPPIFFPPYK